MSEDIIHVERDCEVHLTGTPEQWAGGSDILASGPWRIVRHGQWLDSGDPTRGVMFAGPWLGEFGWELARWQGGLRKLAHESAFYTVAMGDPGHGVLYEWAHEYWEVPPEFWSASGGTRQCDHVRGDPARIAPRLRLLAAFITGELRGLGDVELAVPPRQFKVKQQKVVRLAAGGPWSADMRRRNGEHFCIVPRCRAWNAQKNWPIENWHALVSALTGPGLEAAVVGTSAEVADLSPGYSLPEHLSLMRSINLLSHARFAVAPESGGALLSLLCGCPTLVFGSARCGKRITRTENFLDTPVHYLARPGYTFTVKEVADAAGEFLRTL